MRYKEKCMAFRIAIIAAAVLALSCGSNPDPASLKSAAGKSVIKSEKFHSSLFNVNMASEPGDVGVDQPVKLTFAINDSSGKLISDLAIVHERPAHLLIVSDDLAYFNHIHPEPNSYGTFTVETSFPSAGKYLLFL